MGSSRAEYHQWQVIFLHFGDYWEELEERCYSKEELKYGINVGREFSKPHMAIVLSPNPLCRGDTLLVVPITNYTPGDERRWDKIVIFPRDHREEGGEEVLREPFLQKKSSIHLSAIRMVSKQRIIRTIVPYITKKTQRQIRDRLYTFWRVKQ